MNPDQQITEAVLILEQTGQTFPLGQELITIGRKSGNTIVLEDDLEVSRHHATISSQVDGYLIRDVGSANGTYLNDQRLTGPERLDNNDIIRIGASTFLVKLPLVDTQPSLRRPAPAPAAADLTSAELEPDATAVTMSRLDQPPPPVSTKKSPIFDNPYVGPRTFSWQESNLFFGREVEARELLSLTISERLVLFYAQSGAGKSSLINARLIPQLREADFAVLPVGRVSGELPEGVSDVENIFLFNLLLSLDESDGDPNRFTHMPLTDFLVNLTSLDGQHYYYDTSTEAVPDPDNGDVDYQAIPYILIIDQFEEIITAHAGRWPEREGFFRQLEQAMTNDPLLWVMLTLREDYVAALDPYIHLLPDKLRARFYMQRMSFEAALEAVKKPAERYDRPFAPGVAERLVDNLRQIRVQGIQSRDRTETRPGQFVEPVQLQVVCYQLWENLKNRPVGEITEQNLQELGDVDIALAQFYEQALAEVIQETDVSEIDLRNWFENQLITEAGTRGTVYRGSRRTGGIDNQAVDLLANKFLLRSEVRTGGTWYELVHDRFVDPILQANQAWRLEQPLIQMAQTWIASGRSENQLLEGQQLHQALTTSNWPGLGGSVREFLNASQAAEKAKEEQLKAEKEALRQQELKQAQALAEEQRKRAEEQAQATARLRKRNLLLAGFVVVATVMAIAAIVFGILARQGVQIARAESTKAIIAQQTAVAESTQAAANAEEARRFLENQQALVTTVAEAITAEAEQEVEILEEEAQSLEATITAQAATAEIAAQQTATSEYLAELPTETPTPEPSTATPTGRFTPPPSPTDTFTPTASPTPTPNLAATGTAEAIAEQQAQLQQIRAEQTTIAQQVSAPAPDEPACLIEPEGPFAPVWKKHQDRLGCPSQREPIAGAFAEQPFERGFMVWTGILDIFIVAIGDGDSGVWERIEKTDFNPSGEGCEPSISKSSPDLVQPIRGFGGLWCQFPEIQQAIGYGTEPEYGASNLIQEFENGIILRDSNGSVYVLFSDDGTYERGT